MQKTLLIIQREYQTRVRKKSFIIMTLLAPLLIVLLLSMPAWLENLNQPETKKMEKEIEMLLKQAEGEPVIQWQESARTESTSESALVTGMTTALLIYLFILIYGAMVMRGVVEEKTSRVVEIIVSSVKPFELMIGKIAGIALVGLTQFLIWAVMAFLFIHFSGISDSSFSPLSFFSSMEIIKIGFFFVLYFVGGYLLYASLFAAIGAMSDSETDTQQFLLPIILPVIFAMLVAVHGVENPHGQIAFWSSIIPFTSPIVMMIRIPAGDVSMWELILSVSLLLLSFVATTWVAAKIYRTGILMYGKKVTYKEIWKWLRYK